MNSNPTRQFNYGLIILLVVIFGGTIGFEMIESEWDLSDSFYMTIITISTTGFKEVKPLSEAGRLFTVVLIISGVGTIAYTGSKAAQIFIENQFFRRKRMSKKLESLRDHYIVCGYGRMGKQICEGLRENKAEFIVVENDEGMIEKLTEAGVVTVFGDAASDETLIKAGIEKAKGIVAVVKTDAENVFTTLSAKELNPNIFIVARAIDEGTESKLLKAGADRVVKPYELGGNRMVQLLLKPGVMDFIDSVARDKNVSINLEELTLTSKSALIGKTLANSIIRKELNIIIVAIYKNDGSFFYNPVSTTMFEVDDKLIAIGESENLNKLTDLSLR